VRFLQALSYIRESLVLTQMAFAKELGVSFTSVNRWENEVQKPSSLVVKTLKAYCKERGLAFMYEEEEPCSRN
jgi:putative transcriptional regulator